MSGGETISSRSEAVIARLGLMRAKYAARPSDWRSYLIALGGLALVTIALIALRSQIGIVNVAMVYLLGVLIAALRAGRGPAIVTAISAFVVFNIFFLPP
jgi:K+-sensing histidine kinase KdpD